MNDELEPASAPPAKRRRWLRELASWLIPIFALVFGFGYRCVREPIFIDGPGVAGPVTVKPEEIASVAVFPRPEGKRTVTITGVHLAGATKGLTLVDAVARNLKDGNPTIRQVGPPPTSHRLSSVKFQSTNGHYLVLEVKANAPGAYRTKGVNIDYRSGIQRGTHRMKVAVSIQVK